MAFQFLNHNILGSNVNSVVDGKVFQVHLKPFLKVMPAEKEKNRAKGLLSRAVSRQDTVYIPGLAEYMGTVWICLPHPSFFFADND